MLSLREISDCDAFESDSMIHLKGNYSSLTCVLMRVVFCYLSNTVVS
jgi:hypothetical protein